VTIKDSEWPAYEIRSTRGACAAQTPTATPTSAPLQSPTNTPAAAPTPTSPAGVTVVTVPLTGGVQGVDFRLPNGETLAVTVDTGSVQGGPLTLTLDPNPAVGAATYAAATTGAPLTVVGPVFDLRAAVGGLPPTANAEVTLTFRPDLSGPLPPGARVILLREFAGPPPGFLRVDANPNPDGTLTAHLPLTNFQGTLFLPASLTPAFVQNHDPLVHMWSGPTLEARDFGFAGPQFTTFTVVAPQVGSRLDVYSPVVNNYGWVDAGGVGPSGPP
jgi:hypothetical protein